MKNDEKWQEIYTKEQLKSIQNIEKDILKEFIRICDLLGLEYFVYGGTLLGQVKYKDIIPWDDDIDVAMPRNDYNKFLEKAPNVISKEFIIQSPYNEKKSPFSYTKIRRVNTKYIEKYHHKLDIEKGIYIDLYPVDNIPDDDNLRKKQWKKAQMYCKLYFSRQCLHASISLNFKKIFSFLKRGFLYVTLRILPQSFYMKKIDYYMTMYDSVKTKRKACLFSPNYNNIYIKLFPLLEGKFGDLIVKIPNCYDDHLCKRYGDYKKDLPKEKRIGHIPFEIDIPKELMSKEV